MLIEWFLRAALILLTTYLVPGFRVESIWSALVLVLILGLLNLLVKPVLILLTLPINFLTLGLFTLLINGLILQLAVGVTKGVESESLLTTLVASLVMTLLSTVVGWFKNR
jgi:putative membrane protein